MILGRPHYCPTCGVPMVLESPIFGGPDEWRCLACPPPDDDEPATQARAA